MNTARLSLVASLAALVLAACAASTSADDTQPTADTAQDISVAKCTGVLPHVCETCSDGSTECAHWTVKSKKCSVAICPGASRCAAEHALCATNSHFDHTVCKCVRD